MLRLYIWPHRILYLGLSPDNDLHRHHAAQFCVSLDANLTVRDPGKRGMLEMPGVIIPPDYPHQIDAGDARILALYLEPESDEYEQIMRPLRADAQNALIPLTMSSAGLTDLCRLFEAGGDADTAWSTCASALGLEVPAAFIAERDPRIGQVIDMIRGEPGRSHSVRRLAKAVHLSPSRLTHLFREQIGVPIRRFTVWTRVREVIRLVVDGTNLTEAAHAAGFSDAAHMSNSFRRMFGFAPSALFTPRIPMDIHILD